MPRTIDEGFRDFLERLKPSSFESQAAASHRTSIESCLRNNFGLRRFARIGSFGNGTSVSGCSDVDYLTCLPKSVLTQTSSATMAKVRAALDYRFPYTGVHIDCPAVVAPFGTTKSEITELVVAGEIGASHGFTVYQIPDCDGGWMRAAPDAHNAYVTAVDKKHGYKVKPLIRFVKAWKCARQVPVSSFYLELRIAKYADGESSIVYDIDVQRILSILWNGQLASTQDPMGVSGMIRACKSQAAREVALSKLATASTRAEKARAWTQKGDIREAFQWWRLIYNDQFPTYYR